MDPHFVDDIVRQIVIGCICLGIVIGVALMGGAKLVLYIIHHLTWR